MTHMEDHKFPMGGGGGGWEGLPNEKIGGASRLA